MRFADTAREWRYILLLFRSARDVFEQTSVKSKDGRRGESNTRSEVWAERWRLSLPLRLVSRATLVVH